MASDFSNFCCKFLLKPLNYIAAKYSIPEMKQEYFCNTLHVKSPPEKNNGAVGKIHSAIAINIILFVIW